MGRKDKLIDKLLKKPKDFTFDEMKLRIGVGSGFPECN